jgi:hypothetical protein
MVAWSCRRPRNGQSGEPILITEHILHCSTNFFPFPVREKNALPKKVWTAGSCIPSLSRYIVVQVGAVCGTAGVQGWVMTTSPYCRHLDASEINRGSVVVYPATATRAGQKPDQGSISLSSLLFYDPLVSHTSFSGGPNWPFNHDGVGVK